MLYFISMLFYTIYEINTVNQLQLNYSNQHTPIDTAIYEKFVCYNNKTKYTD